LVEPSYRSRSLVLSYQPQVSFQRPQGARPIFSLEKVLRWGGWVFFWGEFPYRNRPLLPRPCSQVMLNGAGQLHGPVADSFRRWTLPLVSFSSVHNKRNFLSHIACPLLSGFSVSDLSFETLNLGILFYSPLLFPSLPNSPPTHFNPFPRLCNTNSLHRYSQVYMGPPSPLRYDPHVATPIYPLSTFSEASRLPRLFPLFPPAPSCFLPPSVLPCSLSPLALYFHLGKGR